MLVSYRFLTGSTADCIVCGGFSAANCRPQYDVMLQKTASPEERALSQNERFILN
jgi:hypothetical protein